MPWLILPLAWIVACVIYPAMEYQGGCASVERGALSAV